MSEVERFDAYYGYPSCRANGRHIHANGEFVLASDYDALAAELARVTAERDALAKRINCDGTPVDIAALCVEIDEATDELARVKAESLRVVKVCEPVASEEAHKEHNFVLHENMVCSADYTPYGWVQIDGFVANVRSDDLVQPVRLERWEASDE